MIDWAMGKVWEPAQLHFAFHATRFARRPVAVWLYEERMTVASNATLLAQSTVEYQPDGKHFRAVSSPHLYATQYQSPQLPLWKFGEHEWVKVLRLPPRLIRRKQPQPAVIQARLFR